MVRRNFGGFHEARATVEKSKLCTRKNRKLGSMQLNSRIEGLVPKFHSFQAKLSNYRPTIDKLYFLGFMGLKRGYFLGFMGLKLGNW